MLRREAPAPEEGGAARQALDGQSRVMGILGKTELRGRNCGRGLLKKERINTENKDVRKEGTCR